MSDFIQVLENNTELLSAGGLPGIAPVANPGINSSSAAISIPGSSTSNSSSPVTLSEPVPLTGELDPEPLLEPKSQPLGGLPDPKTAKTSEETADPVAGNPTKNFTNTTQDATGNSGDHAGLLAGPVADTDPLTGERSNPTNPKPQSLLATTAIPSTQSSTGGQDVTGDPLLAPTQTSATTTAEPVTGSSLAIPDNFTSGVFTVGKEGEVGVDFLFDGGAYKGELAIFSLAGMEDLSVNSVDFIREATQRALSGSKLGHVVIADRTEGAKFGGATGSGAVDSFNTGDYLGLKTFQMTAGDKFAVMMSPDGSFEKLRNNPNAGGSWRPLFSLAPANPNAVIQTARIADLTGDGQAFAMEDLRRDGKSDKDFNDLVFQFRGATGRVTNEPGLTPVIPDAVRDAITTPPIGNLPQIEIVTDNPVPGQPVGLTFQLPNTTANQVGSASVNFYLSADRVIGDSGDILLGHYISPPLEPGNNTGAISGSVILPPNDYPFWNQLGDGQYYIGMAPRPGSTVTTASVLNALEIDLAGNTLETARRTFPASDLGKTYQGVIGGNDREDRYTFDVGLDATLSLELSGISGTVGVQLLDAQGNFVASGSASSGQPLIFDQVLARGGTQYQVQLTSDDVQPTDYQLNLKATSQIPGISFNAPDELVLGSTEATSHPDLLALQNPAELNRRAFDLIGLPAFRALAGSRGTGAGSTVAVLDSSIYGGGLLSGRVELIADAINSEEDNANPHPHGTMIGRIIAASDPMIGVAPNAQLLDIKVLRRSPLNPDVASAIVQDNPREQNYGLLTSVQNGLHSLINWMEANPSERVDVVNLSLATRSFTNQLSTAAGQAGIDQPSGLEDEIAWLTNERGVTVVVAAGNDYGYPGRAGMSVVNKPSNSLYSIGVGSVWPGLPISEGNPVEFNSVHYNPNGSTLEIGNTTTYRPQADQIAPFSMRHPELSEIFAPGVGMVWDHPEIDPITGATPQWGTSTSAAVISGVAALAQDFARQTLGRSLLPHELRYLMVTTADSITDTDPDPNNPIDSVPNTGATYKRINMERLGAAIVAMGEARERGVELVLPRAFSFAIPPTDMPPSWANMEVESEIQQTPNTTSGKLQFVTTVKFFDVNGNIIRVLDNLPRTYFSQADALLTAGYELRTPPKKTIKLSNVFSDEDTTVEFVEEERSHTWESINTEGIPLAAPLIKKYVFHNEEADLDDPYMEVFFNDLVVRVGDELRRFSIPPMTLRAPITDPLSQEGLNGTKSGLIIHATPRGNFIDLEASEIDMEVDTTKYGYEGRRRRLGSFDVGQPVSKADILHSHQFIGTAHRTSMTFGTPSESASFFLGGAGWDLYSNFPTNSSTGPSNMASYASISLYNPETYLPNNNEAIRLSFQYSALEFSAPENLQNPDIPREF